MQRGVKSLRCIMQRGVKSRRCIIARSQIFPLHFAAERCDSLLHDAVGVRSYHCKIQKGVDSYRYIMQRGVKSYCYMMQRRVHLAAGSQVLKLWKTP